MAVAKTKTKAKTKTPAKAKAKAKTTKRKPAKKAAPAAPTYPDIKILIADSRACSFDYRIGDFVQNVLPHPSRGDVPIYGFVIRVGVDALGIHRANVDQSLRTDAAGGPKVDFIMKAAAALISRAKHLGEIKKINLREYLGDGAKLAALKRDPSFVYMNSAYLGFPQSPLANPYATKTTPKEQAKADYDAKVIAPAIAAQAGPVWNELSTLADRILNTEAITLGCWCADGDVCHVTTIIDAATTIAQKRQGADG